MVPTTRGGRPGACRDADLPRGMEHAALFRAERRGFAEHVPLTGEAASICGACAVPEYSGRFSAKRLTTRRRRCRARRLTSDAPGRARFDSTRNRRSVCARTGRRVLGGSVTRVGIIASISSRASFNRSCKRLRVPLCLHRVLRRDDRSQRRFCEIVDGRIQEKRRHQERREQRQNPCGDGRMSIPHHHPRRRHRGDGAGRGREDQSNRRKRPLSKFGDERRRKGGGDPDRRTRKRSPDAATTRHGASAALRISVQAHSAAA